ncbi:MAG: sigma-70 family RNA polymerase sigma factor, partial [Terriglobales bacterium]
KAYRAFGTFSRKTSVKNWLTAILINAVRDHLRKNARTISTIDFGNDQDNGESLYEPTTRSPEQELCDNAIDPALIAALKSMPEEFLVPLLLREIQDASYEEIAKILEIPQGTVMSRLSRARALLRKKLLAEPQSGSSLP